MSVLKHLKMLQHVSIFSDHLQGARRFLVKVTECVVCVCAWRIVRHAHTHTTHYAATSPQLTVTIFNKVLNSVTLTRNLRAP
jgi:hypothetical protein